MKIHIFFITLFLCFVYANTFAGTVVKTSGKKVYILFTENEGGTFQTNDLYTISNPDGKKVGIVVLKKVKGYKAVGLLKKGSAEKGHTATFRSVSKKSKLKPLDDAETKTADEESQDDSSDERMRWGLQAGYGLAEQDVTLVGGTAATSGSSLAIKGIVDYPLFSSISVHGGLGTEMFSTTGTQGTTDLSTKITYISIDTLLKWSVYKTNSMKFYLLGGAGILSPLSKSSNAIDEGTITSLAVAEFGGGFEWKLGRFSLPMDVTYYMFPEGETVSTSIISFKIGVYF